MKRIELIAFFAILTLTFSCQTKEGQEQFCKSPDGVEICYTEYGQGDNLVVFVHGWSCDKSYWREQIDFFKQDFHVVTIDLGGHGNSGMERTNWTMSAFGDDVNSVLKQFKFKKAYLVGHSMGSDVILEANSSWKENNIELFLVDRFNDTPTPFVGESFNQFFKPFSENFSAHSYQWIKNGMFIPESDSKLIEWIASDMSQANPDVALSALKNLFSNNYIPILEKLNQRNVPMTLINSDYQPLNIENLKKVGFEVITISECGHFVMMEQPINFNNKLKGLITK